MKAKRYWLVFSTEIPKYTLYNSVTVKKFASRGNGCQLCVRVRNNRVQGITVYCLEDLDKPLSLALGFSHRQDRSVIGINAKDNEALSFVIFYYGLYALKGFFTYRVLTNSLGRSSEGSV